MSASTHSDLEALRRTEPTPRPPGRRVGTRVVMALLILGLIATAYAVLQPILFPPRAVRVAAVLAAPSDGTPVVSGKAVQDVGWLEAFPFPTTVRPLVSGVLEELPVLEGQEVTKGKTVIGRLRNLEIENAHDEAVADLALAEARTARALAAHTVADSLLAQKLDQRRAQVDIAGLLESARKEVVRLQAERKRTLAARRVAQVDVDAQKTLIDGGGGSRVAYRRALAALDEASERVTVLDGRVAEAKADVARLEKLLVIAREGVDDPRGLQGDVDLAAAALTSARAAEARATVARDVAKRNLDHLTVLAPRDGIVLRLESAPGAVVGPQGDFKDGDGGGPGSTSHLNRMTGGLVSLYDPAELQVRVDVLFAQVSGIRIGGKINFTVDAIPGHRFTGTIDRLVHEADINQNALQVKIRVKKVHPRMRPEMLCRVTFETVAPSEAGASARASRRHSVPSEAVRDGAVFVFDPTGGGRARRVPVTVVGTADGRTIVDGDIGVSNRVILDPVEDGEKVRIRDE